MGKFKDNIQINRTWRDSWSRQNIAPGTFHVRLCSWLCGKKLCQLGLKLFIIVTNFLALSVHVHLQLAQTGFKGHTLMWCETGGLGNRDQPWPMELKIACSMEGTWCPGRNQSDFGHPRPQSLEPVNRSQISPFCPYSFNHIHSSHLERWKASDVHPKYAGATSDTDKGGQAR